MGGLTGKGDGVVVQLEGDWKSGFGASTPLAARGSRASIELPSAPPDAPLFEGVFLGGFECSTHRLENGRRLDLLASTRHEEFVDADYARLQSMGMTACRDGIPWVRAERTAGAFDFSFALPMIEAAKRRRVQVVWDLMHFGWPDHVDVFDPSFASEFGRYALAFARWFANETDALPMITPINEMSFLAWAGGDVRFMNPFEAARGVELKAQFVRATIHAIEAIRSVLPHARFVQPEPIINIVPHPEQPKTWARVESDNLLQYQAWDMLAGRVWPALGGAPKYLDILGVNFYSDNQFMLDGTTVNRGTQGYKPLSAMLLQLEQRYGRPLFISETGAEGEARAGWLRYVVNECLVALANGCNLHGVTLYPIINHPGWLDGRHCENGLWDYTDDSGARPVYEPLAAEILRLAPLLANARAKMLAACVRLAVTA